VLMPAGGTVIPVGRQNCTECLRMLTELKIPVDGKDLGGTSGRSVYFETETCVMRIKKLLGGECQL
jgi:chemotaxis receptor (MCP) glutamine deamidase CheD